MDRRDFVKRVSVGGTIAGGLASLPAAALATNVQGTDASGGGGAMLKLLDTVRAVREKYLTANYGINSAADIAEGERLIAHVLWTGFQFWLESDLYRPAFTRLVTADRKLLGDNPDALYYFAPIADDHRYQIRGNIGSATFMSFTVVNGSAEGRVANGSSSMLNDTSMSIDRDGNFEITVSRDKPASGNWLELKPGAGQITARYYFENLVPIGADPEASVPLQIEALDPPPLSDYKSAEHVERRLGYVANYVRGTVAMSVGPPKSVPAGTPQFKIPDWFSTVPNQFNAPGSAEKGINSGGYGNLAAWYAAAPYALGPDEALVITSRFPSCRFANVALWNRFLQTYDYARRQVSLNRNQIKYEADGSFRLVVAHKDPGVANWLDTEGRPSGTIYWRWMFPIGDVPTPQAEVVKITDLG